MKISDEVKTVIGAAETDGPLLRLTTQLDRNLYVTVNKALEAAGGKWERGKKAHVFPVDADEAIENLLLTGKIATRDEFGFFETPPEVVNLLIKKAQIKLNMAVLEPSAGTGAIVLPLMRWGCKVTAYEIQEKNRKVLKSLNAKPAIGCIDKLVIGDFLKITYIPIFDRVVMNPPFGKRQDVHHVMHAMKFLKDKGILVSVMSAGVKFRDDRLGRAFKQIIAQYDGQVEDLPEGSFKTSGTGVNTVVVTLVNHSD